MGNSHLLCCVLTAGMPVVLAANGKWHCSRVKADATDTRIQLCIVASCKRHSRSWVAPSLDLVHISGGLLSFSAPPACKPAHLPAPAPGSPHKPTADLWSAVDPDPIGTPAQEISSISGSGMPGAAAGSAARLGRGHCRLGWGKGQAAATGPHGFGTVQFAKNEIALLRPKARPTARRHRSEDTFQQPLGPLAASMCKMRGARSGGDKGGGILISTPPMRLLVRKLPLSETRRPFSAGRRPQNPRNFEGLPQIVLHTAAGHLGGCTTIQTGKKKPMKSAACR